MTTGTPAMASSPIAVAAQRLRDAEHVTAVVGGRAALAELAAARAAMSAIAGIRTRSPAPVPSPVKGVVAVSTIAASLRITTKHNAVWRECAGCSALAALAPDEAHCPKCQPSTRTGRPARRRPLAA
jgi:hypothetical protein